MGMLYKRGNVWWIKYYRNGKPFCESAKTKKKMVANELLKQREGEIADGKIPSIYFDKITFEELAKDYLTDYALKGNRSIDKAESIVKKHLTPYFRGMKARTISTACVKAYIAHRMGQGAKNATINRELSALKRMYNLGARCTPPKIALVPHIPMLRENNVRTGFFEYDAFEALRDTLSEYLRPVVTFACFTGWRISETLGLKWSQVDLKAKTIRLESDQSKNKEGRELSFELFPTLRDLFDNQWKNRRLGCPYVFHREGIRIKNFHGAWNKACRELGLGYGYKKNPKYVARWEKKGLTVGPYIHDFRRTAVRNMVRAGVPERVAMGISGHKTRAVFDRYNIVSQEDLKEAGAKIEAYSERLRLQNGYSLPNVVEIER
jgi:integrase